MARPIDEETAAIEKGQLLAQSSQEEGSSMPLGDHMGKPQVSQGVCGPEPECAFQGRNR